MSKTSKKTSKVVSEVEESVKLARGERLKKLRNMTNLSREELCDTPDFNPNTFKNWEIGRFNGLLEDNAKRVIVHLAEKNIWCSLEWLMNGTGTEPMVITSNPAITISDNELRKELSVLEALRGDILFTEIQEPLPANFYQFGDIVAGFKLSLEGATAFAAVLVGQVCLVETDKFEVMIVQMVKSLGNNRFSLRTLSGKQFEATLLSAARITRFYRD
ncbi:MAG: helix-turn-helix domain-containing protein [Gammaproteobacteria bacterium]|nr:helix-turn-helix domain-containing protein [Gammaproteobacteria bacterium]